MALQPTHDPRVWIEEQREGYTRYRNAEGRRWEVWGRCHGLGNCQQLNRHQYVDCPKPEGVSCCPFFYVELDSGQ